jgi:anti-sigma B factor antagonist
VSTFFIKTHDHDRIRIVELVGKLTIGANCREFRAALDREIQAGGTHIIVNCGQITMMDSSGIGELVGAQQRLPQANIGFALCDIPKKVKDLFRITSVNRLFKIFDSEDDAIDAFTAEIEAAS